MNYATSRLLCRRALAVLALVAAIPSGLLAACSSSNGNDAPSTPIITTGGSGNNAGNGGTGDEAGGGSELAGGAANPGGGSRDPGGDAGDTGEGGAAGEPGAGGSGNAPANCPTSDVGFYNQPSKSQQSPFDNAKRLGTHTTLPPLP